MKPALLAAAQSEDRFPRAITCANLVKQLASVPEAKPKDEPGIAGGPTSLPRIDGRIAVFPVVGKPNVRSEFAADFIAQTQPCVQIREARSDVSPRIILAVEIQL